MVGVGWSTKMMPLKGAPVVRITGGVHKGLIGKSVQSGLSDRDKAEMWVKIKIHGKAGYVQVMQRDTEVQLDTDWEVMLTCECDMSNM